MEGSKINLQIKMIINLKNKDTKTILILLIFLYTASLNVSKFGISFFGGILSLISIFYYFSKNELLKENREIYNFSFGIFILGIFFQILSLGGIKSSLIFTYKNYFLILLPFFIFFIDKNNLTKSIYKLLEISLFTGILKSYYNFYKIYNLKYTEYIRVDSFFDIMRWGIVLVMGLLLILPRLSKKNYFSWIVFLTGIISLILNNSRGPFLSLLLGILIYIIFSGKIKELLFGLVLVFILIFSISKISDNKIISLERYKTRVFTIKETKKNGSNAARIFMWKENIKFMQNSFKGNKQLFFFGTGLKNRGEIFKEYIEKKEEYHNLSKHIKYGVSMKDSHNAYLNVLTETGFIYFLFYYIFLVWLILKIFINYLKTKNRYILSIFSAIVAFMFCGIFYGYAFAYEVFTFYFILGLGLIKNRGEDKNEINIWS